MYSRRWKNNLYYTANIKVKPWRTTALTGVSGGFEIELNIKDKKQASKLGYDLFQKRTLSSCEKQSGKAWPLYQQPNEWFVGIHDEVGIVQLKGLELIKQKKTYKTIENTCLIFKTASQPWDEILTLTWRKWDWSVLQTLSSNQVTETHNHPIGYNK